MLTSHFLLTFSKRYTLLFFIFLGGITSCQKKSNSPLHFVSISSSQSHIDFSNTLTESDSVNFYTNEYMYIGSGVGVGDFDNDGLQDVIFVGSQVRPRLYLNKGKMQFEDITTKANIPELSWCTGVSIVDINQDGWQDIYLCVSHHKNPQNRRNILLINQKNLTFKEEAQAYGLADEGFSTQACFLDYDKDGDLDVYVLNHQLFNPQPNKLVSPDSSGKSPAADHLYQNLGFDKKLGHPVFQNVSQQTGVLEDGYGLGVTVADFNQDTYPDIYVANDYLSNDKLWLNQQNGTFKNVIAQATQHQSYNSMGVDAADLNNDLLPDIMVLDMLPPTNERKKMMALGVSPEKYDLQRKLGYQPEFSRNMLQLHRGNQRVNQQQIPVFSEIGNLAGVAETDWSWSVLCADFDNDGWKDIHITNGLAKDLTNNDFLNFTKEAQQSSYQFGGGNNSLNAFDTKSIHDLRKKLDEFGAIKLNNFFFRNTQNLQFEDLTQDVGLENPSISHGAAYADFDNDGDLDLVINNTNQMAFLYQNTLNDDNDRVHFLTITLRGNEGNLDGFGTKVEIYTEGKVQMLEQQPVRGYASSVENHLHIGLGKSSLIDSLIVTWPNQKVQNIFRVKVDTSLLLKQSDANDLANIHTKPFEDKGIGLDFVHQETPFFDYYNRRLQPQKYSQLGPCLAKGDVNGDGLEDFFVGGASRQSGCFFMQEKTGGFKAQVLVQTSKLQEDLASVLVDTDNDGDLDLLLAGGSTEYPRGYQSSVQLFLNDGKGNFQQNLMAIPAQLQTFCTTLAVADVDHDGDQDIFVGGRLDAEHFPQLPQSYLLINQNGFFKEQTAQLAPDLLYAGMITGAVWTDYNHDNQIDLVIVGEWTSVQFFKNQHGKLSLDIEASELTQRKGMWRSIIAKDLDADGDQDLVLGNWGMNQKYHISETRPYHLFAKDIDNNGTNELLPAYFLKNKTGNFELHPDLDRNQFAEQTPTIKKKFLLHRDFAEINMIDLLEHIGKESLIDLSCDYGQSVWLENQAGKFVTHELPIEAQLAPINAMEATDVNADGILDLILGGNEFQTEITTGRIDASYGLILLGTKQKRFVPQPIGYQGLFLRGDVKAIQLICGAQKPYLVVAENNQRLKYYPVSISAEL